MRKGGGKAKGASFERDICKNLSLWVSTGTAEDVFWRSAMSGGRSTVAAAKGKRLANQAGDISSVSPLGTGMVENFFMECKFYKDLNLKGILTKTGALVTFWTTCKHESQRYQKLPLLIAKQNQLPVVVCLNQSGLEALHLFQQQCVIVAPQLGLFVLLWERFLTDARFIEKDVKKWRLSAHTALGGSRNFRSSGDAHLAKDT